LDAHVAQRDRLPSLTPDQRSNERARGSATQAKDNNAARHLAASTGCFFAEYFGAARARHSDPAESRSNQSTNQRPLASIRLRAAADFDGGDTAQRHRCWTGTANVNEESVTAHGDQPACEMLVGRDLPAAVIYRRRHSDANSGAWREWSRLLSEDLRRYRGKESD